MFSDKPMRIRLAFCGVAFLGFLGIMYLELWLAWWFPTDYWAVIWPMSALAGGLVWSWTLPHPRQERKRREKLEALGQQAETEKLQSAETLAEKRP